MKKMKSKSNDGWILGHTYLIEMTIDDIEQIVESTILYIAYGDDYIDEYILHRVKSRQLNKDFTAWIEESEYNPVCEIDLKELNVALRGEKLERITKEEQP